MKTKSILRILLFTLISQYEAASQGYFQQKVNYKIQVKLDDAKHSLSGEIDIEYTNNSPDELSYLMFHLYPNAYKNETTALSEQMLRLGDPALYLAEDSLRGFIDSLQFKSDNTTLKWNLDPNHIDIAKIYLSKPLANGESTTISTSFYVKIPSSIFSRLGHSNQSYQITQWYPKPAVYDRDGWHAMPYLNQGEFYSEFGNYDVSISLPINYRVGATGMLVDCEDEEAWMDSLSKLPIKTDISENNLSFPVSDNQFKTLRFVQDNIHDFAWFADKRYQVLQGTATLPSGKQVQTQALFTAEQAELWKNALKYLRQATEFYSEKVGEYPYDKVTAVQGTLSAGAGMEYPMITIIGTSETATSLEETMMHEVGHNWFYGLLAFNERDFPWLDEGLNTFYQSLYMKKYHPTMRLFGSYIDVQLPFGNFLNHEANYEYFLMNRFTAAYNIHQASNLKSEQYTSANYGISVYYKNALIYKYLQQYLGENSFDEFMHEFYETWKFKHPQPADFIGSLEKKYNQDFNWLFIDLMGSEKQNDYKICNVKIYGDSLILIVKNKGQIPSPILITGHQLQQDSIYWKTGFLGKKELTIPKGSFNKITVNEPFYMLDYTPNNNFYKYKNTFPKWRKPKLKFITTIPKGEENYLYYSPIIGWNNYNKFMFGGLFYNHSAFEKKWEYELMPLYSFSTKNLNGSFGARRNFYFNQLIRRLSIGISGKKYNYESKIMENTYLKLNPEVIFYFKNREGIASLNNQLRIRSVYIEKQYTKYIIGGPRPVPTQAKQYYNVFTLEYEYNYKRKINPFMFKLNFQYSENITKADVQFAYTLSYQEEKKGLHIRLFLGNIFDYKANPMVDYSYKLSSWDGGNDYLYDHTYLGRSESEGLLASQMYSADGGFYLPSALGRSWGMIGAINLRTSLPFTRLINLYANGGITDDGTGLKPPQSESLQYEGGAVFTLLDEAIEVYFPILWSKEYQRVMDLNPDHNYWKNVRFTLKMDLANPFKALKELHL